MENTDKTSEFDASSQAAVAIPTNGTDTEKRPILALVGVIVLTGKFGKYARLRGCVMRSVSLFGCADPFLRVGGPHNPGTPAGTYTVTATRSSHQGQR